MINIVNFVYLYDYSILTFFSLGDTLSVLPTGYDKSLIFEMVQKMTGKTVILCSPLNSIIEEKTARYVK